MFQSQKKSEFDRGNSWDNTFFLKVYEDPLVYVIASGSTLISGFQHCLKDANGKAFNLLVVPYWNVEYLVQEFVTFSQTVECMSSKTHVYFMCPSEIEVNLLKAHGLRTLHAHQNAFINEDIFTLNHRPKKFTAIHNAAMKKWKRHELAWGVKDICVLTYRHSEDDCAQLIRNYKYLSYVNMKCDDTVEYLSSESVAELISESSCGLALSNIEGANFASGEYQFCGIPVISTPSKGGRHYFFDRQSTIMVEPRPELVVQAVEFAVKNPLDPNDIRNRVIEKSIHHRLRFIDWLSRIVGQPLHSKADKSGRLPEFKDKLREIVPKVQS